MDGTDILEDYKQGDFDHYQFPDLRTALRFADELPEDAMFSVKDSLFPKQSGVDFISQCFCVAAQELGIEKAGYWS